MERRAWVRRLIDFSAVYETIGITQQSCHLRDFCEVGLLVESTGELVELVPAGARITLSVAVPAEGEQLETVHLSGTVRRASGRQIGVQLDRPLAPSICAMFSAASERLHPPRTPQHAATIPGAQRTAVISSILESFGAWWPEVLAELARRLDQSWLAAAGAARSNQEIDSYFAAMNDLRKHLPQIDRRFAEELRRRARRPEGVAGPEKPDSATLSLVDTGEFEKWLLVSGCSGRIESACPVKLLAMRDALSMVYGQPITSDNDPIGPRALVAAFLKTFEGTFTSDDVRSLAFEQFESVVRERYTDLLGPVLTKLEQTGIAALARVQAGAGRRVQPAAPARNPRAPVPQRRIGDATQRKDDAAAETPVSEPARDLSLLGTLAGLRSHPERPPGAAPSQQPHLDSLLQGLGARLDAMPLGKTTLGATLSETEVARLDPAQRLGVDLTDAIFEQLFGDSHILEELHAHLQQLQVPVLKSILSDASFMQDRKHPVRQFVNQIARLGAQDGPGAHSLHHAVDEQLQRVNREFDANPAVLQDAVSRLNELAAMQTQAFLRNLRHVQETRRGQDRLREARNRVAGVLLEATRGKPVPSVFRRLVEDAWRNLLVLVLLKCGEQSPEWSRFAAVPTQLLDQLRSLRRAGKRARERSATAPIEELLSNIAAGLREAGEPADETARRSDEVRDLLLRRLDGEQRDALLVLEKLNPEMLQTGEPANAEDSAGHSPDRARLRRRVRRMLIGDGLRIAPGSTGERRMVLAWRSQDVADLVFVDALGHESMRCTLDELVSRLESGKAVLIAGEEAPVVDRGVLAMIQRVSDQFAQEAIRDPQTGLYNRRRFEELLETALVRAKREKRSNTLCFLSLDDMKRVNASYGLEAGDQMLHAAAGAIGSFAEPGRISIAHIGSGEFGVLVQDGTAESASKLVERMMEGISTATVQVDGQRLPISGSWGIVEFGSRTADTSSLLRAAINTCSVAREKGRNTIHVYSDTDEAIGRDRSMLEWTARITHALDHDQFCLRVQKIAPLRAHDTHEHNEVLLSIVMPDGQSCPVPADLIHAAEAYGLMPRIDRWVLDNSLAWMKEHPAEVGQIGGLAVNVSGASLNDPRFAEYVLEAVSAPGVDTSRLCFEVTETAMVQNLERAADFIEDLRRLGCSFALDDFGSGMASYAYLKNLPVDYLKIDGAFIRDICTSKTDLAFVRSINEVAQFMGMKTIAEFVENEEIVRVLMGVGVDYAQGYGIQKPYYLSELSG